MSCCTPNSPPCCPRTPPAPQNLMPEPPLTFYEQGPTPLSNYIGDASLPNIPLSPDVTYLNSNSAGTIYNLVLPNGTHLKQQKRFYIPGGTIPLTAIWVVQGTFAGGWGYLQFDSLGFNALCEWDGLAWQLLGGTAGQATLTNTPATPSGGGGPPPPPPLDPDVAAFVLCSSISDQTQINAVIALTASLKAAGLWTGMDCIYPFVGGNATAHSCNLRNTAKYSIVWHGPVSHTSTGIGVSGLGAYGDTGFNPAIASGNFSQNSAAFGYKNTTASASTAAVMGAEDGASFALINLGDSGGPNLNATQFYTNSNGTHVATVAALSSYQLLVASRMASGVMSGYVGATAASTSDTSLSPANQNIWILAANLAGTPSSAAQAGMSFAFIGAGLTAGQVATLQGIITAFETALGRA